MRLPFDLLAHVASFCVYEHSRYGGWVSEGFRLMQLCRLSPAQKERLWRAMQHIDRKCGRTQLLYHETSATRMLVWGAISQSLFVVRTLPDFVMCDGSHTDETYTQDWGVFRAVVRKHNHGGGPQYWHILVSSRPNLQLQLEGRTTSRGEIQLHAVSRGVLFYLRTEHTRERVEREERMLVNLERALDLKALLCV